MSKAPIYDCPSCGVAHEYGRHVVDPSEPTESLTYEDALKDILVNLALDTKSKGYVADADVYEALAALHDIQESKQPRKWWVMAEMPAGNYVRMRGPFTTIQDAAIARQMQEEIAPSGNFSLECVDFSGSQVDRS